MANMYRMNEFHYEIYDRKGKNNEYHHDSELFFFSFFFFLNTKVNSINFFDDVCIVFSLAVK